MRFHFVRTGGFAGLRLAATIDTEVLPEEECELLMDELDNANFFELPSVLEASSGGADRFQYEVTVERDEDQHTIGPVRRRFLRTFSAAPASGAIGA
jgi:hypothetical protein